MNKSAFVYMVAVIQEPTVVGEQGGQEAKVLVKPQLIVAGSRKAAIAMAGSLVDGDLPSRARIVVANIKDDAD